MTSHHLNQYRPNCLALQVHKELRIQGPGLLRNSMPKSLLVNMNFQTWLLIGWLYSCQPVRSHVKKSSGIVLCMHPANDRWSYIVTSSLIGWVHTQNDPWILVNLHGFQHGFSLIIQTISHWHSKWQTQKIFHQTDRLVSYGMKIFKKLNEVSLNTILWVMNHQVTNCSSEYIISQLI